MIKKLRMKLILASMISLLVVLVIIEGAIGILNYQKLVADANETLDILKENGGRFPESLTHGTQEKGQKNTENNGSMMSPELPYESRYFSVIIDENGDVTATDTGKVAKIDTAAAAEYARTVWEKGQKRGFIEEYRYTVVVLDLGVRIIFLDCGRSLSTYRNFVLTALGGLGSRFAGSTCVVGFSVCPYCKAISGEL